MIVNVDYQFGCLLLHFKLYLLMFFKFQFKSILVEGDICASQRRASAEGLGYLARLGNDIFTARMVSFPIFSCYTSGILWELSLSLFIEKKVSW